MAKVKMPYVINMKPGEYFWCSCGESVNQPLCDGSHNTKQTGMLPVRTVIEKAGTVAWCGCKASRKKPFCDGTHQKL